MVQRKWWESKLHRLWEKRSVIWLSGVRRSGKTVLCQNLEGARYFDCEQPSVRRELSDPESFLRPTSGELIVLDEIHRLDDPAQFLKIAADHFPETRIVATGSSTLGASSRFRDTLTGRKAELTLTPLCEADSDFPGHADRSKRFLRGGLPGFFMGERRDDTDYSEWMESFWARDILELFRLERRSSFLKFAELLFAQSGGRFEAASFTGPCSVSRPTIMNYLAVLDATHLVHVVRPYHGGHTGEITSVPLVYGFDTGFVAWSQGLHEIPDKDKGFFWEHLVLNELIANLQSRDIMTWRDKQKREVDFIWAERGRDPVAMEVKWKADSFEPRGILAFRTLHPGTMNLVVASDIVIPYTRTITGLEIMFTPLNRLAEIIKPGIIYGK